MTVSGPVNPGTLAAVDAHNHVWIESVAGAATGSPQLTAYDAILKEMRDFAAAGGGAIVDCQPGGCGRNGLRLLELSRQSGVSVIASTGFHRRKYYGPAWWLWEATTDEIAEYFLAEIKSGVQETKDTKRPVRAGLIKCACEASLRETPRVPLEAAASVAAETGICVEVHTERGADAAAILGFFVARGVRASQLVLCHMDKAPNINLHRDIAQAGACLEYDTFYRPKYLPETHVWPLIEAMISSGFDQSVALATDMADPTMWSEIGDGPGLVGFLTTVRTRLLSMQLAPQTVADLTGRNIARRLAGSSQ